MDINAAVSAVQGDRKGIVQETRRSRRPIARTACKCCEGSALLDWYAEWNERRRATYDQD